MECAQNPEDEGEIRKILSELKDDRNVAMDDYLGSFGNERIVVNSKSLIDDTVLHLKGYPQDSSDKNTMSEGNDSME